MATIRRLNQGDFAQKLRDRNAILRKWQPAVEVRELSAKDPSEEGSSDTGRDVPETPEIRLNDERDPDCTTTSVKFATKVDLQQPSPGNKNVFLSVLNAGKEYIPFNGSGRKVYLVKPWEGDIELSKRPATFNLLDNWGPAWPNIHFSSNQRIGSHSLMVASPHSDWLLCKPAIFLYDNEAVNRTPPKTVESPKASGDLLEQDIYEEDEHMVGRRLSNSMWKSIGGKPDEHGLRDPGVPKDPSDAWKEFCYGVPQDPQLGMWEEFTHTNNDPAYPGQSNEAIELWWSGVESCFGKTSTHGGDYTQVPNGDGFNDRGYYNGQLCPHGLWSNGYCLLCSIANGNDPRGHGHRGSGGRGGRGGRGGGGRRGGRGGGRGGGHGGRRGRERLAVHARGWRVERKELDCHLHHRTWGGFCHQDCQYKNPPLLDHGHPPPEGQYNVPPYQGQYGDPYGHPAYG